MLPVNLTVDSIITELSDHACNFVLKVSDTQEPKTRVWPKLMSKLQPKIALFLYISVYLPAFLHNFHNYTSVYFSDPIIKIS